MGVRQTAGWRCSRELLGIDKLPLRKKGGRLGNENAVNVSSLYTIKECFQLLKKKKSEIQNPVIHSGGGLVGDIPRCVLSALTPQLKGEEVEVDSENLISPKCSLGFGV